MTVFALEDAWLFIKFGGAMLGIMLLIFILAVLTPKMAAFIDNKILKKSPDQSAAQSPDPERVEEVDDVQSPFGAQITDEDLNYKIYNEDIYAIKRKKDGNKNG